MPDQQTHEIVDALAEVKPQAESKEPVVAQLVPSTDEERTVAGLSRRITRVTDENKALKARLAEVEKLRGNQGEQSDRQIAAEIVKELVDADSRVDKDAEIQKLRQALRVKEVQEKYRDPLVDRLVAQGVDVSTISDEFLAELREAAQASEFSEMPRHNTFNRSRFMSAEQRDIELLKNADPSLLWPAY